MRVKVLVVAEREADPDPHEPTITLRVANPEALRALRLGARCYVELVSTPDDAPASASASRK